MTSISEQLNLIEAELTRIRAMAEQVCDDYLLYVIDMAIAEVEGKSGYGNDNKRSSAARTATWSLKNNY
jgi:hypothetical protein